MIAGLAEASSSMVGLGVEVEMVAELAAASSSIVELEVEAPKACWNWDLVGAN